MQNLSSAPDPLCFNKSRWSVCALKHKRHWQAVGALLTPHLSQVSLSEVLPVTFPPLLAARPAHSVSTDYSEFGVSRSMDVSYRRKNGIYLPRIGPSELSRLLIY